MRTWVSATLRVPEDSSIVFVVDSSYDKSLVGLGFYRRDKHLPPFYQGWHSATDTDYDGEGIQIPVTHWMEIDWPDKPKS